MHVSGLMQHGSEQKSTEIALETGALEVLCLY